MQLEQLNLTYLINEDRILLRIGFAVKDSESLAIEKQEIQLFITRRLLQRLWPVLMESISSHMRLNRPETAFASEELINLEHQEAVGQIKEHGNFSHAYEGDDRKQPLGDRPLLLEGINFHLKAKSPLWIQFITQQGQTIDLKLETNLLHGFCKLLIDAEKAAAWDLELKLPKAEEMSVPAHLLN